MLVIMWRSSSIQRYWLVERVVQVRGVATCENAGECYENQYTQIGVSGLIQCSPFTKEVVGNSETKIEVLN